MDSHGWQAQVFVNWWRNANEGEGWHLPPDTGILDNLSTRSSGHAHAHTDLNTMLSDVYTSKHEERAFKFSGWNVFYVALAGCQGSDVTLPPRKLVLPSTIQDRHWIHVYRGHGGEKGLKYAPLYPNYRHRKENEGAFNISPYGCNLCFLSASVSALYVTMEGKPPPRDK